jgi:glycosyltransferase involved in cell wall biosynthesis
MNPPSNDPASDAGQFGTQLSPRQGVQTPLPVEAEYKLAKLWRERGKYERALAGYRRVLQLAPQHLQAHVELSESLLRIKSIPQAVTAARRALSLFPNEARLHKSLVQALLKNDGNLDGAFAYYQLTRRDNKTIQIRPNEILCCCVVRNELARLPYFLSFYREKGIGTFLIVDNHSTDGTLPYLLQQPDVHTWASPYSFNHANFGSAWFELLLRAHGVGHWCLIVDADELLYYPDCEDRSLVELCNELEAKGKSAFPALLLEMYSDRPIGETHYVGGQRFEDVCPYFDKTFYHTKLDNAGPYQNQPFYFGGVRQRVFGAAGEFLISKVPLLRYSDDIVLAGGQHWTSYAKEAIADERGCLLHFKFFSSFPAYVTQEVHRAEHSLGAFQYQKYAERLSQDDILQLYDERHSVKLRNSGQLVDLGIMQEAGSGLDDANQMLQVEFPTISPFNTNIDRPFWSVMITVYNRVQFLEQALRSVIVQAPDPETMQIEVINDGGTPVCEEIAAIVRAVAGDRVTFYKHSYNLGHPHIFNLCIERARGQWVHILHDDDWVQPGFYTAMKSGIEQAPEIGSAFCRHVYADVRGVHRELAPLEKLTPGVHTQWLQRIVEACWVQTPAIVVKRHAYEQLGGYCPEANSAFDWEMWKRIAVHYPVWYEPRTLACFRVHSASESDELIRNGQQLADTRRAIEISRTYLPEAVADKFSDAAQKYYAVLALNRAKQLFEKKQYHAAFENIREGLACSRSEAIERAVIALLRNQ